MLRRKPSVSTRPFAPTLQKLLRARGDLGVSPEERLLSFSQLLEPASASRLVEVVDEGIPAPLWLIEECADALGVKPEYFAEYRIHFANRNFDVRLVGYEQALANLNEWAKSQQGN